MAVTPREVLTDVAISTTASVTTGAGTQATDLLLAIGMSEFYNLSGNTFGPPTGGGWTQVATAELSGDDTKLRAWVKTAPGGATQIDLDPMIDEGIALAVLVLEGADLDDPVEDSDGAASSAATPSVHVAPSVSPASADAFLVCAAATAVFGGVAAYTPPGGMDEEFEVGTSGGGDTSFTAATEQLASSGATGTRSFGFANNNVAGVALSLAIAVAGEVVPPTTPFKVADRGSAQNLTSSQSTVVDLPNGGSIDTTNNILIARWAGDNSGGGGQATNVDISDPRGNTWVVGAASNRDPGAASAGITGRMAYCIPTTPYQDGDDLTFNYGNNTAADAVVVEEWANIDRADPVAVTQVVDNGGSASPAVTIVPTAADQLVYGWLAIEGPAGDTYTQDTDTTNGTWVGLTSLSTESGTAASNATVRGAYKLVTADGSQTWDPTITNRDWAAGIIVFNPAPVDTGVAGGGVGYGAGAGSVAVGRVGSGGGAGSGAGAGVAAVGRVGFGGGTGSGAGAGVAAVGRVGSGAGVGWSAGVGVSAVGRVARGVGVGVGGGFGAGVSGVAAGSVSGSGVGVGGGASAAAAGKISGGVGGGAGGGVLAAAAGKILGGVGDGAGGGLGMAGVATVRVGSAVGSAASVPAGVAVKRGLSAGVGSGGGLGRAVIVVEGQQHTAAAVWVGGLGRSVAAKSGGGVGRGVGGSGGTAAVSRVAAGRVAGWVGTFGRVLGSKLSETASRLFGGGFGRGAAQETPGVPDVPVPLSRVTVVPGQEGRVSVVAADSRVTVIPRSGGGTVAS